MRHFFSVYKSLEGKQTAVDEVQGRGSRYPLLTRPFRIIRISTENKSKRGGFADGRPFGFARQYRSAFHPQNKIHQKNPRQISPGGFCRYGCLLTGLRYQLPLQEFWKCRSYSRRHRLQPLGSLPSHLEIHSIARVLSVICSFFRR